MAHDFAKLRATERPGPHRRGRGAAPRVSESAGSHWSWFFTGLFSGLFAAFVVYLALLKPTPAELGNVAGNSELAAAPVEEEEDRRFDFYDYLPAAEVAVNVEPVAGPPGEVAPGPIVLQPTVSPEPGVATLAELAGGRSAPPATTAPVAVDPLEVFAPPAEVDPPTENASSLPDSPAPAPVAAPQENLSVVVRAPEGDNFQYLLQAGSFQSNSDAESHRARIILLNMDARVVPGTVSGQTWYRVQVGPFAGRQSAEAARDNLAANAIESIPLRMK